MRHVSFDIAGKSAITVTLTEQADGSIKFDLQALPGAKIGDLRGLFFDVRDASVLSHLQFSGADVTGWKVGDEKVIDLGRGATMAGDPRGPFDAGVAFGTPGLAKDNIQHTSFTLSSDNGPLTLDLLAHVDFGARFTSSGDKASVFSPAAPNAIDDAVTAKEDLSTVFHLLSNDTDEDVGDQLRIIAVTDPDHGSVTIAADGKSVTYTSDLNYSGPDDFHYTISDGHGGGDDATASVGVIAVADAPALTVTTVAGAHVNEIQVTVSAAVTDTDGSEYIDRFQFSNLPSGVQLLGQTGGVIDPAGHPASLTQVLTLVLPMDVDANFDFTVTAVSKEVSNGDEATSAHTTDVVLDANSTTVNETFTATDQSIWGSGDQFTFTDDRFLGFSGSFGDSTGGFIYGDASASITAGFQSKLTFEGGQIDASAPYEITIDTNFNRTTDVLLISGSNTLGPASFTTAGPAGSYVLDFIFNYALHAALGIDFEIDSYDLFSFDLSGNHTINILDLQSADIGASIDLPYGLSVDLAWPNVDTTSGASLTNQFSSSGASNNFLQLNVDVDQALADIFLKGVNPFTASFDVGVAGGTAELLDLDLSGGLNFIQDFLMTVKSLTGVLTFENGATRAYDFSDIVLDHASGYDANHDGIVQFVLSLAPNVDLHNSTDLGFNIGYSFDLLKASGWWDVALDSGSWSEGPVYHTGGTMPVISAEVYDSTFALNFGSQDLVFGA